MEGKIIAWSILETKKGDAVLKELTVVENR